MFVIAMAGLGFAVMTLQVAEYQAANPPGDTSGPVMARAGEVSPSPSNSLLSARPGMGAAAPAAARNPYISETRQLR